MFVSFRLVALKFPIHRVTLMHKDGPLTHNRAISIVPARFLPKSIERCKIPPRQIHWLPLHKRDRYTRQSGHKEKGRLYLVRG